MDNFFQRLGGIFRGGKDNYTQTQFNSLYRFMQKGENYVDVTQGNLFKLYETTPHLKAVIDRKSDLLANGRFQHKRYNSKGEIEIVENSPIINLIENPNPLQNGNEFLRNIAIMQGIFGLATVNKVSGSALSQPKTLWVLPSEDLVIKTSGMIYKQTDINDIISEVYINKEQGGKEVFELKDLIFFREINAHNPVMGLSPITSLKLAISNIRGAYGFRNRIITSNAMLGILSSDSKDGMGVFLDENVQKRISQGVKTLFGMQDGKDDILQTKASVKWIPMSYPTKELMLFEEVTQSFKIIIDAYGLNENIFSFERASTFSNLESGLKQAYQDCIIPYSEDIALGLSKGFNLDPSKEWIHIDYSHIDVLKENTKVKTENDKRVAETISILTNINRQDLIESVTGIKD
jgi:phage portal protein BeeE